MRGVQLAGRRVPLLLRGLRALERTRGPHRLVRLLAVLAAIARWPTRERRLIASPSWSAVVHRAPPYHGIQLAIHTVFERFADPLHLGTVLAETHMSKATFCRQFRRFTGRTFFPVCGGRTAQLRRASNRRNRGADWCDCVCVGMEQSFALPPSVSRDVPLLATSVSSAPTALTMGSQKPKTTLSAVRKLHLPWSAWPHPSGHGAVEQNTLRMVDSQRPCETHSGHLRARPRTGYAPRVIDGDQVSRGPPS